MHLSFFQRVEVFANPMEAQMTKREMINTGNDKRYVRRDNEGKFKESVDVSRSLSADAQHDAKNGTERGQGDKGDRKD
jgi:hypothetical protein